MFFTIFYSDSDSELSEISLELFFDWPLLFLYTGYYFVFLVNFYCLPLVNLEVSDFN